VRARWLCDPKVWGKAWIVTELVERPALDQDRSAGHLIAAVFSASADAVIVVDQDGSIVLSSAAVTPLFGYFPEELVGEPLELLVPPALRGEHATLRKRFLEAFQPRQMGSGLQLYGLRRDGVEVPIDVSLSPTEIAGRRYVAAFVRDARERVRNIRQLEAVIEVTRQLLAGASIEQTVTLTLERARELVDAASAWLVRPELGGELKVTSASGLGAAELVGTTLSASTSRSAQVLATGELDVVQDLAASSNVPAAAIEHRLGPAAYVPLASADEPIGVLVAARRQGEPAFSEAELNVVRVFSGAAAVALTLGETRQELERLRLIEEDERIARDLHDTIVQRAFAVGMSLEAVRRLASGPVLERIDAAVQGLDDMIRDLRNAIFRLSHPLETGSVRAKVAELAEELSSQLGFTPRVAFRGQIDDRIDGELASELLSVLREALSNVARHAKARSVDVAILAEESSATLVVSDDGVGIGSVPKAGSGLANMAARAERLGGSVEITRSDGGGTVVIWRVPLAR
jgi:PAS domain S-box-containing protein